VGYVALIALIALGAFVITRLILSWRAAGRRWGGR
jgi:hypothetical protein